MLLLQCTKTGIFYRPPINELTSKPTLVAQSTGGRLSEPFVRKCGALSLLVVVVVVVVTTVY